MILDGEAVCRYGADCQAKVAAGTCAMPILSGLCDTDGNLGIAGRWTAEWGAEFVLTGGSPASKTGQEPLWSLKNIYIILT